MESSRELQRSLAAFASGREREESFQRVSDHLDGLIYHAALRQARDTTLAREVTQNVLILISKKAAKLSRHPHILAWVHEATRLEVRQMSRATQRRKKREAHAIMTTNENSGTDPALLEELDHSLGTLSEDDRELILMRFFEGRSIPAIAARTGRGESAEKMRLKRALEKLSRWFGTHGITLSVAGLTTVLSTEMSKAAPVGVVGGISGAGVVGAGSGKFAGGVALLIAAGFAVPVVSGWNEVRGLRHERDEILTSRVVAPSDRTTLKHTSYSDRKGPRSVLYEPTSEEMNLPVAELAWRYRRADEFGDDLTKNRIELVVERLDWEELEKFGLALESNFPHGFLVLLNKIMKPRERVEFMMKIRAYDQAVAYDFAEIADDESLAEAANWLFEKTEEGGIISSSVRHNYRKDLWESLHSQLKEATLGDGKTSTPEKLHLIEKCVVLAPVNVRRDFEKLRDELERQKGGKE